MKRRSIFAALVVALIVSFAASAGAAPGDIAGPAFSDIAGHEAEGELTLMAALGIFSGDSGIGGTVRPDDPLTRAQFCKVVVEASGKGHVAAGLEGIQPAFVDGASIPTWAWGYVNAAVQMGVINGYEDGTFRADRSVTYAEALTMLVRAVPGHDDRVSSGDWPYNYLFYAAGNGFVAGVDLNASGDPCTRGDMAKLLLAMMQVPPILAGGSEDPEAAILAGRIFDGMYTGPDGAGISVYQYGQFMLADQVYMVGEDSWDDLFFQGVRVVTDAPWDPTDPTTSKVIFIQKTWGDTVHGFYDSTVSDATSKHIQLADGRLVPFPLNETTGLPVNHVGVCLNGEADYSETDLIPGDELDINLRDDGTISAINALRWDVIETAGGDAYRDVVDSVTASTSSTGTLLEFRDDTPFFYLKTGGALPSLQGVSVEIPDDAEVTINGAPADRDDLQPFDVVRLASFGAYGIDPAVPPGAYYNSIIAVAATRRTVEGTVSSSSVSYPGPHHLVTLDVEGTAATYELDPAYGAAPANGSQCAYLLDERGQLFFNTIPLASHPVVLVTGATTTTDAEGEHRLMITDTRGVTRTYEGDAAEVHAALIGYYFILTVDGTGDIQAEITFFTDPETWTVMSVTPAGCTIRNTSETEVWFCPDATTSVYGDDGTEASWIGLEGLQEGDVVTVYYRGHMVGDDLPDGVTYYVLVRDDS